MKGSVVDHEDQPIRTLAKSKDASQEFVEKSETILVKPTTWVKAHLKKHSHFSCPIQLKAEKKQALQFELNRLKIHSVVVHLASRLGTQTAT